VQLEIKNGEENEGKETRAENHHAERETENKEMNVEKTETSRARDEKKEEQRNQPHPNIYNRKVEGTVQTDRHIYKEPEPVFYLALFLSRTLTLFSP